MIKVTGAKDLLHYQFATDLPPVARASSGDTVVFECVDCYCNQIKDENTLFSAVKRELNNPVSGPLYINGAKPGDVLKVSIVKIELADKGVMTARPNAGLYGELITEHVSKVIPIRSNVAYFREDIAIDLAPMIGVLGVAAHTPTRTTYPGEHGGNLDCRDLGEGASIYLPVNVEGALLSMGDVHGVQGDGETVICALEADGTVTVKVEVLTDRADIPTPFIVTPEKYITLYSAATLDEAAKAAAFKMHKFLHEHSNLSVAETAMMLSLCGNLRICQVVNPLKTCGMEFPRDKVSEKFTP